MGVIIIGKIIMQISIIQQILSHRCFATQTTKYNNDLHINNISMPTDYFSEETNEKNRGLNK